MAAYLTTPALLVKAFLGLGVPDSIQGVHEGVRALFAGLPHFDSSLLLQGLLLALGEVDHLALEGQLGLPTHTHACLNSSFSGRCHASNAFAHTHLNMALMNIAPAGAAPTKLIAATKLEDSMCSLVFVVKRAAVQPCPLLYTDACVYTEGDGHAEQPGLDVFLYVAQLALYGSSRTPARHNLAVTM